MNQIKCNASSCSQSFQQFQHLINILYTLPMSALDISTMFVNLEELLLASRSFHWIQLMLNLVTLLLSKDLWYSSEELLIDRLLSPLFIIALLLLDITS